MNRRAELGEFLRSRRARLQPSDVGIRPLGGQRRVPGLRREELALLAGMSVDYYVRLEQGRCPNVSDPVLDAVARALQLDEVEHRHLRNLARPPRAHRSQPEPQPGPEPARAGLQALLDAMREVPAYVVNHRVDVLAWNAVAAQLFVDFADLPAPQRNWARLLFEDEATAAVFVDWEAKARDTVAFLRMNQGRHPDDEPLSSLVDDLVAGSDAFRRLWSDQSVKDKTYGSKKLRHPLVGELTLDYHALQLPDAPDQVLIAYTAARGSAAETSLRLLSSAWPATEVVTGR